MVQTMRSWLHCPDHTTKDDDDDAKLLSSSSVWPAPTMTSSTTSPISSPLNWPPSSGGNSFDSGDDSISKISKPCISKTRTFKPEKKYDHDSTVTIQIGDSTCATAKHQNTGRSRCVTLRQHVTGSFVTTSVAHKCHPPTVGV